MSSGERKRRRKQSPDAAKSKSIESTAHSDVSTTNTTHENQDEVASTAITDPLPPGIDLCQYRIVKRVPHRAPTRQNEIYVSRKSHAKAQLARAKSLLLHPDVRKRVNSITVFGLGAAMAAAVDLALRIVDAAAPQVVIDVVTTTGTTPLHDDYEPLVEGVPAFTRTRYNGLVRIDLTRRPAAAVTASAAVASKT